MNNKVQIQKVTILNSNESIQQFKKTERIIKKTKITTTTYNTKFPNQTDSNDEIEKEMFVYGLLPTENEHGIRESTENGKKQATNNAGTQDLKQELTTVG